VFRPAPEECIAGNLNPWGPHDPRELQAPLPGPKYEGGYKALLMCPGGGSNRIFMNVTTEFIKTYAIGSFPQVAVVTFGAYYNTTHFDRDPAFANLVAVSQ